jgi:hypothetical protein
MQESLEKIFAVLRKPTGFSPIQSSGENTLTDSGGSIMGPCWALMVSPVRVVNIL